MTKRILTVGVVLVMSAGIAFAAGLQESNVAGTAPATNAARGYGAGPGEAGVPVEACLAELGDEAVRVLAVEDGSPAAAAERRAAAHAREAGGSKSCDISATSQS